MSRNDFKPKKKKIQVNSLVHLFICHSNEALEDDIIIQFPFKVPKTFDRQRVMEAIEADSWLKTNDLYNCSCFIPVNVKLNKNDRKQKGNTKDKLYERELKEIKFSISSDNELGNIIKNLIEKKTLSFIENTGFVSNTDIEIRLTYQDVSYLTFHVKRIFTDHDAFSNNIEQKHDLTDCSVQGIYEASAQQAHIYAILQDANGSCIFMPLCLFRLFISSPLDEER